MKHGFLDGKKVVVIDVHKAGSLELDMPKFLEWCKKFETQGRIVKQEYITFQGARYFVSTVFLGLDHEVMDSDTSKWFETMIFPEGRSGDLYCERYETWEEAEKGHEKACMALKECEALW